LELIHFESKFIADKLQIISKCVANKWCKQFQKYAFLELLHFANTFIAKVIAN